MPVFLPTILLRQPPGKFPCQLLLAVAAMLASATAQALPSFADQTGQPCAVCHTASFGPGLTPYGQNFKLNGYTGGNSLQSFLPLAAMQLSSFTHTTAGQAGGAAPGFKANNDFAADQTSLFFAGRINAHMGALVQLTDDGVAHRTHWDNADLRYARHTVAGSHAVVWGLSLNNNPTVQDLWNTTPAWSFPYANSPLAPKPVATPLLEGALAQEVGGLTAYTMIDDRLYLEAGVYRSVGTATQNNLGMDTTGETTLRGAAPYWRVALQRSQGAHYASLGAFGMRAKLNPGGVAEAGSDAVQDNGLDATYQYDNWNGHRVAANLTWLRERRQADASVALGAASVAGNHLDTLRFNVSWIYRQTWVVSGGPFMIRGGSDSTLYAPAPVSGSARGSPDTRGFLTQLEYIPFGKDDSPARPWLNLRTGVQYVNYSQFNGGGANYDGSGRAAGDNNTLYLYLWWAL